MRIVFSGGGTGGHIFPATAVADEMKRRFPNAQILFIGALGKMEMEKVPKAGYSIRGLWISGFQRQLTFRNLLFPAKLLHSLVSAYFILRDFKPDVVAGFGGYASGAALFVATRIGIPTLIQEQNSFPGITNKLLANRVDKICVADSEMSNYFPIKKMKHTGNPVRYHLTEKINRELAKLKLGLDIKKRTVLIAGGSLGARTLNIAMKENCEKIATMTDVQFIWQCGSLYSDEYKQTLTARLPNVMIMPFIDHMEYAYGAADLVICRAGALTVSELCLQGKATIFVPSPNVAEDHQTKNAMSLVVKKAALILKDKECVERLGDMIHETLEDSYLLLGLEQNISQLAKPYAVKEIADELEKLVNGR